MTNTIVFHGGVQVAEIAGRHWVPKDEYDKLLEVLREIDDACSDYDPTYIRSIAREAHSGAKP